MARTTVEDCLRQTPNHFELVIGAVARANELRRGVPAELPEENDRPVVVALREIAAGHYVVDLEKIVVESLKESVAITSGETSIAPQEEGEGAEAAQEDAGEAKPAADEAASGEAAGEADDRQPDA
ncbi:MAG: DNA-directed RNA polymerase subunit omega [Betaproteobacteria bacterium AqS2]|uniref:DNA-directed RNA polymerase subunit omega n=1 Tax=Candidatus Amphirhobacter heronislandensis TaxID=1732024 RepID=A0A930UEE1_9GAMM|nr:DNA-directed RNA polymerase subunit omega [Betaproteobacteria bacterium AqS2]